MSTTRRAFIAGATLALAGGGGFALLRGREKRGVLLSAFEDARGEQYVGGLSLDEGRVFGARAPMRAHGCAVDPRDPTRVVFFARRPGTQALELRRDSMTVSPAFTTGEGRHLAGHGVFSPDGEHLFTPEHDYQNVRGVVTVRDARTFAIVHESDTHGIDPHEVAWLAYHPSGQRSLLVANGGILTHPRSYRLKLNIPTMDPSLCVIDALTGDCREQHRLSDHLLSIRHLAVTSDGGAVVGLQYEGTREQAPALAAIYRPGVGLRPLTTPTSAIAQLQGYVASVAVSESQDLVAAACPYGAGVACWSLREGSYTGFVAAHETYGLSRLADGSLVASQRDGAAFDLDEKRLRSHFVRFTSFGPIRWDDHWTSVAEG